MPVSISRLRIWFAVLAIAIIAVVAGFYFYARLQNLGFLKQLPAKLGVDIQQCSQGFSLSKSEGGRTLFTIRAANAVQYTDGGRAELRDVNIVVYGRQANRFDQIYGSNFEYDPKAGTVVARGEVNIDLRSRQWPRAARSGAAQGTAKSHPLKDERLDLQPENRSSRIPTNRGIPRATGQWLIGRGHL